MTESETFEAVSPGPTPPNARTLIGVCTYEESANIEALLREIRESMPEADVLVVDDNSPDGTAELVRGYSKRDSQVHLLLRTENRGLGNAILAAIEHAISEDYDFFLNLDGDFSHDPKQLPSLLEAAIADSKADVVVGSRYVEGGQIIGWPIRRKWMSRLVNRFAITMLRLPVRDCSGSMRCYRVQALSRLDLSSLKCQGYALLEELLVRLDQLGCKMLEVPITFTERQFGKSKLTLAEAVRSMGFMMKLAVSARK